MSTLAKAIWELHKEAENQLFVKDLLNNNINTADYVVFLQNRYLIYNTLESFITLHNLFKDHTELYRTNYISEDLLELNPYDKPPKILTSTTEYITYLYSISNNVHKLWSHIYVHFMGDLNGGQLLASRTPGSGKMYTFDGDVDALKSFIKSNLDDTMADEAKTCFKFIINVFRQLYE